MPKFILESSGSVTLPIPITFDNLTEFTQGYIEALFFTCEAPGIDSDEFVTPEYQDRMREGQTDGCLPGDVGYSDIHPLSLQLIIDDCAKFQADNAATLQAACDLAPGDSGYRYAKDYLDARRAGQLFWYARNGHGVAFTDDGDAACLESLQCMARLWGEVNPFFGNDHVNPDCCVHLD